MAFSTNRITCRLRTFLLCLHATNLFFISILSLNSWVEMLSCCSCHCCLRTEVVAVCFHVCWIDCQRPMFAEANVVCLRGACFWWWRAEFVLVSASEVYRSDARWVALKLQLPAARRACVSYPCLEARMCVPATIGWALDLSVRRKEHFTRVC